MSKTLLDGVNDLLKRMQYISGDAGSLSSLSDGSRQKEIDAAVSAWNDTIEDLFSVTNMPFPKDVGSDSITLVDGQREYALPTDLVQIRWPLKQETDGYYIYEYPGGYEQMRKDQPQPDTFDGRPYRAAINPITGGLYLEFAPQSAEAGDVYDILYDKDISVSSATDVFPFIDAVYRRLVPGAAEVWRYYMRNQFSQKVYNKSLSQASRYLTKLQARDSYMPGRMKSSLGYDQFNK
jgi:hypothetical protein